MVLLGIPEPAMGAHGPVAAVKGGVGSAASVTPRPAPPSSSGMAMPNQPVSAMAEWNSVRKLVPAFLVQPKVVIEAVADPFDRVGDVSPFFANFGWRVAESSRLKSASTHPLAMRRDL